VSRQIPEYYRDLASDDELAAGDRSDRGTGSDAASGAGTDEAPDARTFRADAFRCRLPAEGWTDRSVYTFTGPTADGLTHTISITTADGVEAETASAFAEAEREQLAARLDGYQLLMNGPFALAGDRLAHRVLFFWYPDASLKLYQEQLFTIHEATGYVLSAAFTATTRKQIGAEVEDMMRSFRPGAEAPKVPFAGSARP